MIEIHVDNYLVIGKDNRIDEMIIDLKKSGFNLKVENNLIDDLIFQLPENAELKEILILQPHLINHLEAKFRDEVKYKRIYKTPVALRFKIVCPENDEDIIEPNLQIKYRSGVGMLYLIKYSRPDLCNVIGEFSNCMDKATMGTYLEMLRVVKFVIDIKKFCLKICLEGKIENWILHVFFNSDLVGDSEKRISITGFIVYLMNVSVCWRSKVQRRVTLSLSKDEYVAISEAVKEIKFIYDY
jgi:hypothetical protein